MSDSRLEVKSTQVKDIFNSMDYNKQAQNTDLAKAWLSQHDYVCKDDDEIDEIASFVDNKVNRAWANTGATERIRIINKFIAEIETNTELICQVELLVRGILPHDTKKHSIKHIIEYLMYYSTWSFEFEKSKKQRDPVAAIISDDDSLANLGYVLALTLASGSSLLLQTGPRINVFASVLKQLAINAGIPADTIVIPFGSVNPNSILSVPIGTVYIFDHLYSSNFSNLKIHSDNKIVAITNLKTSAIVFNNADVDSACKSIINAVWEYQGFLPWSVDTIIVQEDIFQNFIDKFLYKLGKLQVGKGREQSLDNASSLTLEYAENLQRMIETARSQGIEVHQFSQGNDADFKPTVFVGSRVYRSNVVIENSNVPSATILPFRTANEAVSLANNSRQGLAVSIWSQNVDLVNEVAQKVEVGTVWVNCHGIVKADVSFEPRKGSGLGYFGGPEGFYEYIDNIPTISSDGESQSSPAVNNLVAAAKKAQQTWGKLPVRTRIQKLSNWALEIDGKKLHREFELNPELWISSVYDSFKELSGPGSSTFYDGKYYLRTHHEPLGVVVLRTFDEDAALIKTVTGALFLGNAVIIVTDDENSKKFSSLTKSLPVFISKDSNFYDLVNHKDVGVIIAKSSPRPKSLVSFKKIYAWQDDWNFILRRVTQTKNIWLTVGDSFA